VIRVPGGKPVAKLISIVGFAVTTLTIGLSLLPPPDEPNKPLALLKILGSTAVLLLIGVGLFWWGKRRAAQVPSAA
jgi:glutamate:GABA antiporter